MPIVFKNYNPEFDNFNFGEPKINAVGGKSVFVSFNGEPLEIQGPNKMFSPYGVNRSRFGEQGSTDGKPTLEVSFKGKDERDDLQTFYQKIIDTEEVVKRAFKNNSQLWMKKKKLSNDMINEMFKSCIKKSVDENGDPNGKYPDTMKLRFKFNNDMSVTSFIYNKGSKDPLSQEEVNEITRHRGLKSIDVKFIIRLQGIWISSANIGITWRIEQLIVYPNNGIGKTYAFQDESEEESEDASEEESEESEDSD